MTAIDKITLKAFITLTFGQLSIIIRGGSSPPRSHPVNDLTKLAIAVMRFATAVTRSIFSMDGFLLPLLFLPMSFTPFRIYIITYWYLYVNWHNTQSYRYQFGYFSYWYQCIDCAIIYMKEGG